MADVPNQCNLASASWAVGVGLAGMGVAVGGIGVGVGIGAAVAAGVHPAVQTITRQTKKKNGIVRFMVALLLEQIITF